MARYIKSFWQKEMTERDRFQPQLVKISPNIFNEYYSFTLKNGHLGTFVRLWFSMIFKIGLNIVHGFMNATFIDDSLCQWSLTINVHSCIYEHTSCMINDHRNNYEHWSSMIIDIDYHSWRSMIVAMKCCWSYMISVDHCIISWTLPYVCIRDVFCRVRPVQKFSCLPF